MTRGSIFIFIFALQLLGNEVETSEQLVMFRIKAALTLTIPADLSWGDLVIGDNVSTAQTVNVISDQAYDLKIMNIPTEDSLGRLMPKQYDTAQDTFFHSGLFISDTLQWKGGDVTAFTDITTSYALVLNDAPATPPEGTNTDIYYKLNIGYGDRRLTGTNQAYAIKVNFLATQTIAK